MLLLDKQDPDRNCRLPAVELDTLINTVIMEQFIDPLGSGDEEGDEYSTKVYDNVEALPFTLCTWFGCRGCVRSVVPHSTGYQSCLENWICIHG